MIFKWTVYYLLKYIKFLVRKNKTLKNTGKWKKILEKSGKSQRILSARKSGNPEPGTRGKGFQSWKIMEFSNLSQQESIPIGCVPSAAVAVMREGGWGASCFRGVYAQGVSSQGKCLCPGGCLPGAGVCLPGGVLPGGVFQTPPMNRITDRCKNATLPQLRCGWWILEIMRVVMENLIYKIQITSLAGV